jgi:glycosyltransferase involved in cell wall biosynthesis
VTLEGFPLERIPLGHERANEPVAAREARHYLSGLRPGLVMHPSCEFVYERYSLWNAGGLALARDADVPFVLEVNSPLPDEAARYRGLVHEDLARGVAQLLMREADGIVCVTPAVASWVGALRGHEDGVWVIPNGVDARLFSPARDETAPDLGPEPTIAFCGSFRPWHGMDDLLEAFRIVVAEHVPGARLVCVGDGPLRRDFERNAREAGLADRVHVTGLVPQHEVPRWLREASVAVAPYPRIEGFYFSPLKIYEFLSMGLPVVAADTGEIPSLLGDGERGLLYEPGQPRELARALAQLLADAPRAQRMGRRGRRWVLDHATWSRRVDAILDGVRELPRNRGGATEAAR